MQTLLLSVGAVWVAREAWFGLFPRPTRIRATVYDDKDAIVIENPTKAAEDALRAARARAGTICGMPCLMNGRITLMDYLRGIDAKTYLTSSPLSSATPLCVDTILAQPDVAAYV